METLLILYSTIFNVLHVFARAILVETPTIGGYGEPARSNTNYYASFLCYFRVCGRSGGTPTLWKTSTR